MQRARMCDTSGMANTLCDSGTLTAAGNSLLCSRLEGHSGTHLAEDILGETVLAEWGGDRYCATCNEPEFSEYAVNCRAHTDDNMIEA